MSAYSVAVSGLLAQSSVAAAHAQNIANAGVTGKPSPRPGERVAYQPIDPVTISTEGGNIAAQFVPVQPGSVTYYDPSSADSNEEGLVAVPNVNLEEEIVGLLTAKTAYAADAKIISVQREMDRDLLNIFA